LRVALVSELPFFNHYPSRRVLRSMLTAHRAQEYVLDIFEWCITPFHAPRHCLRPPHTQEWKLPSEGSFRIVVVIGFVALRTPLFWGKVDRRCPPRRRSTMRRRRRRRRRRGKISRHASTRRVTEVTFVCRRNGTTVSDETVRVEIIKNRNGTVTVETYKL
jgi:hypothetical protein